MRAFICICVSLMLIAPQIASAGKQKSGGGGKAAAHSGGGGGSRATAHPGGGLPHSNAGAPHASGSGMSTRAGMGQHNLGSNNAQSGGNAAHTQHGLNAAQAGGQHGLNAHQQSGQHGLNPHQQAAAHGLNSHQQAAGHGLNARTKPASKIVARPNCRRLIRLTIALLSTIKRPLIGEAGWATAIRMRCTRRVPSRLARSRVLALALQHRHVCRWAILGR